MSFVERPKPKVSLKEKWINFNKSITSFFRINKFIYFFVDNHNSIAKYVRSLEGYEEAKANTINTLFTGLLIGFAIWSWNTGNSFLRGISIAITLVIIENYIQWLKNLFKKEKR